MIKTFLCILGFVATKTEGSNHHFHNNRPVAEQPRKVASGLQLRGSQLTPSGKFRRTAPVTNVYSVSSPNQGHTGEITSTRVNDLALEAKQRLFSLRGSSKAVVLQQEFERKRKDRVIKAAKSCLEDTQKCNTFATLSSVI